MTQLEMMTSTELSGSGIASISPFRNSTLSTPAFRWFSRASDQHLVGHVEAVRLPGGAHAPGRQQHVDAAAGAQVQHRLAGRELGQGCGVAAAEGGGDRLGGQRPVSPLS